MFSLLAICLATASTVVGLELGDCPAFVTKPDFEVPGYVGRWFEIEKFSNAFQLEMVCVLADYTQIDEDSINVYNTGLDLQWQPTSIVGNASVIDPNEPGSLELFFEGYNVGLYNILETDYITFTTVYACTQIGLFKQELAWVLSRTPTISPEILDLARSVFTTNGIDVTQMISTYQGENCTYVDPPPAHL